MQFDSFNYIAPIQHLINLDSTLPTVRCNQIQTFAVIDEWQIASRSNSKNGN